MGYALPYEAVKEIQTIVKDPQKAEIIIRVIEGGLSAIEEKAKQEKVTVKAELKDELTKELVTKAELGETEARLSGKIEALEEKLRGEIKTVEEQLRGEIRTLEESLRGEIKAREEGLRAEIHKWRADTIKWMFIFWIGQIATFSGILIGVLKWMLKQ